MKAQEDFVLNVKVRVTWPSILKLVVLGWRRKRKITIPELIERDREKR